MLGQGYNIDLNKTFDKSNKDLGAYTMLGSSPTPFITGKINIIADLYKNIKDKEFLTAKEQEKYSKEIYKIFAEYMLANDYQRNFADTSFSSHSFQYASKEANDQIKKEAGSEALSPEASIAQILLGVQNNNKNEIIEAWQKFTNNSINSFIKDIKRMSDAEISFEDGRKVKMFEFLGYDRADDLINAESGKEIEELEEKFVTAFREAGLGDQAIANLIMNFHQKSLTSAHANSSFLYMQANPGFLINGNTHNENIFIDQTAKKILVTSRANIKGKSLDTGEEYDAGISAISYIIPIDSSSKTDKKFKAIMEENSGYDIIPQNAEMLIMTQGDFKLPALHPAVVTNRFNIMILDQVLPPLDKDYYSMKEVSQAFKDVFNMQRGEGSALGIKGRLKGIINEERKQRGQNILISSADMIVTPSHINKLTDKLLEEQGHKINETSKEQVKEEILKIVELRARLNKINPEIKLNILSEGKNFTRFDKASELWGKIKHRLSTFKEAWNIAKPVGSQITYQPDKIETAAPTLTAKNKPTSFRSH